MIRKLISLSLVAVMLSVTAFAATDVASLQAVYAAEVADDTTPVFAYAGGDVEYVTETANVADAYLANAKHEDVADLPAWDGKPAEAIVGGTGTADDPYLISNGAELAYFAQAVNGTLTDSEGNAIAANKTLCAKLDRDINLAKEDGTKNPWGSYSITGFTGVFDGQGHNIYNYYSNNTRTSGFFASVGTSGQLKNFNMIDVEVYVGSDAENALHNTSVVCASIVGGNSSSNDYQNTLIENVYVSGNVKLLSKPNKLSAFGTIACKVQYACLYNCVSEVNVDFSNAMDDDGSVLYGDTRNAGNPTSSFSVAGSSMGVGGVIGYLQHDRGLSKITNCGNTGNIDAPKNYAVGGVIGRMPAEGSTTRTKILTGLWNTGDITGRGQVAGVIGYTLINVNSKSTLTGLYNTGNITATGDGTYAYVSGVVNFNVTQSTYYAAQRPKYIYSTGNVIRSLTTTDGVVEKFDERCGLLTCGSITNETTQIYRNDLGSVTVSVTNDNGTADNTEDDYTENIQVPKWTHYNASGTTVDSKYVRKGTGMSLDEIKAITTIPTALGSNYVADFGINEGMPILAVQKNALVLDEETYEIANYTNSASEAVDKNLAVKATEAGYVAINVTKFVEGSSATLEVYKTDGTKLYDKEVSAAGVVLLPTEGETEVIVKAAAGSRVLAKQTEIPALAGLEAALIKATLDSASDATIVLALFNGDTLETVEYLTNVASVDGKVTGVIDLTEEAVAGCTLKAYVWANGTLVPVSATVETLN